MVEACKEGVEFICIISFGRTWIHMEINVIRNRFIFKIRTNLRISPVIDPSFGSFPTQLLFASVR